MAHAGDQYSGRVSDTAGPDAGQRECEAEYDDAHDAGAGPGRGSGASLGPGSLRLSVRRLDRRYWSRPNPTDGRGGRGLAAESAAGANLRLCGFRIKHLPIIDRNEKEPHSFGPRRRKWTGAHHRSIS